MNSNALHIVTYVQNTITTLGYDDQHNGGGGGPVNEHENLHFDNEQDVRMSIENHVESGHGLKFKFANHLVLFSNPGRSGLEGKMCILRPIYFINLTQLQ